MKDLENFQNLKLNNTDIISEEEGYSALEIAAKVFFFLWLISNLSVLLLFFNSTTFESEMIFNVYSILTGIVNWITLKGLVPFVLSLLCVVKFNKSHRKRIFYISFIVIIVVFSIL